MPDVPDSHEDQEYIRRCTQIEELLKPLEGTFDAFIFIATWQTENAKTATLLRGDGNWHAQNGMVAHFLAKRRAQAALEAKDYRTDDEE